MKKKIIVSLLLLVVWSAAMAQKDSTAQRGTVVDEVIWVVGDEAILKSDVESMRRDPSWSQIKGNPYCVIPERLAIQKLFLDRKSTRLNSSH